MISHMRNTPIRQQNTQSRNSWHRTRFAYHEAGHALVGHVLGRLIAEVSIVSDRDRGYKGYCAFDAFTESMNDRLQWQKDSRNPELITIMYAGTVGMKLICDFRGWDYERWRGCDKADFDYIYQWSLEAYEDDEQRSHVQKACRQQAYDILNRYFFVLDELAAVLLAKGRVSGGEVHSLIRESLNETGPDWRLNALGRRQ